jgi:acetolactate synthase-1/2/3 large subunit
MPTNAQRIASLLQDTGVRYVFGIPSAQVLALIEALHQTSIEYVLVSHEMAAGFMADVCGRLTGKPGVCLVPPGPGATNLATGVGGAYLDRAPMLAITGQVPTTLLQRRVHRHVDHCALYQPITKGSFLLRGTVTSHLQQAISLALAEPPGPVHLDLPEDVAIQHTETPTQEEAETMLLPLPSVVDPMALHKLEYFLRQAQFPLVALGLTAMRSRKFQAIQRFVEQHRLPFVTTLMAKGLIPETHPLFVGVLGQARQDILNAFCHTADLILGIGYDPVEIRYEEWMPKAPLIHISVEPVTVDLPMRVVYQIMGNFPVSLQLLAELPALPNRWTAERLQMHRERLSTALRPVSSTFAPHQVVDILRTTFPREGILTCDAGAHRQSIGQQWPVYEPQTLLTSNGWSAMGFAIPAAIAAKLIYPEKPVACILGDGGWFMSAGEVVTALRLGLSFPIIVLHDGQLSLTKVHQHPRQYTSVGVKLGEKEGSAAPSCFGVPIITAHSPEEFHTHLREALHHNGPTIIEACIDPTEYEELLSS